MNFDDILDLAMDFRLYCRQRDTGARNRLIAAVTKGMEIVRTYIQKYEGEAAAILVDDVADKARPYPFFGSSNPT